jgi:hypothetical protein
MPLDQNIPVCYTAIDIKRTKRGPDIKFFKKVGSAINSRAFAYTSFVLSVCAAVFLSSATYARARQSILFICSSVHLPEIKKTAYALLSGAGGVMVFRVGCDRLIDDQNSVTGGIEDTLNRYVTGW